MYGLAACPCMRALPRRCIYDDWRKLIHEHREAQTGPRFADTSERLSAARSQVTTLTAKRDELVLQLKLETRKHGRGTHGCPLPKSDVAGSERLRLRGELSAMVGQLRASLMTLDMMVAQGSADAANGFCNAERRKHSEGAAARTLATHKTSIQADGKLATPRPTLHASLRDV